MNYSAILLIAALFTSPTLVLAEQAVPFDDLKLTELKGNAVMRVLDLIQRDYPAFPWTRIHGTTNPYDPAFSVYWNDIGMFVWYERKFLILKGSKNREGKVTLKLDTTEKDPIYEAAIFGNPNITVRDFNSLLIGKIKIEPLAPEKLPIDEPELLSTDEESFSLNKFDLPAKLKFEEDIRIGVLEDTMTFKHPTSPDTRIKIMLKEKLPRARVIPKDKTFEVSQITYDKTTGIIQLTLDSKDIASVECVRPDGRPFSTKEFYEIMGSKASLIQNTDPPIPVN